LPAPVSAPVAEDVSEIAGPGPIHEPSASERTAGEPVEVVEPERTAPETEGPEGSSPTVGTAQGEAVEPEDVEAPATEPDSIDVPVPPAPEEVPEVCSCGHPFDEHGEPGTFGRRCSARFCGCGWAAPVARVVDVETRVAEAQAQVADLQRKAPTVTAENGSQEWAELAVLGDVDGVRVRLVTGKDGQPWVDVRRFVQSARYSGRTRKGFAIRADSAQALADLLADAATASEG
jgi:hypothetical protein